MLSNAGFLLLWGLYLAEELRVVLAERSERVFRMCCRCGRHAGVEEAMLRAMKADQNEIVIESLEAMAEGKAVLRDRHPKRQRKVRAGKALPR